MKNLKWIFLPTMLKAMLLLFVVSCRDSFVQEPLSDQSTNTEEIIQWNDLLNQFDLSKDIIIVQKEGSIQEAIDAAKPGDAIYIEPGTYREALKISKDNLKLIGLNGAAKEQVILENPGGMEKCISTANGKNIEIINITAKNFTDIGTNISLKCTPNPTNKCSLISMKRSELPGGIAHYQFKLRLGPGAFDVIVVHRLIRESIPYRPVPTKSDIFMMTGSTQDFDDIFLTAGAEEINTKTSSPLYLASKNIDVWGLDFAWTLVPAETEDFMFMKDWGIDRDIDHAMVAMSFARLVRALSIHKYDKLNVLGFCYSVPIAYGAAGRETQLPKCMRNIKGLIPVDFLMKYAPEDEEFRDKSIARAANLKAEIESGIYVDNAGITFQYLGNLAISNPDGNSEIFPGLSNKQVLLFMGSNIWQLGNDYSQYWHFSGGDLNDFFYCDFNRFLKLAVTCSPYEPKLQAYEVELLISETADVSFDDHLNKIKLPIFYLGANGGTGKLGEYTSSLTSSTDVTNYIVSVDGNPITDYGHADLWMGRDADKLVWEPLRRWLVNHN
jgi:hypothetical protein